MAKKIYLDAPNVGELEKEYLARAIDAGYVSTAGPFVGEFEERFAGYLGVNAAVSTQSGTAALRLALHELGVGPGDEVIVPALTFIATANPVSYVGATPVFADVDTDTWTIDPSDMEKRVTDRTKAVIPVHIYGNPCPMDEILAIARARGLYVIEDATESLGALYKGRHTGTIGDFGCFSFNGNKLITTGGGGMITGNDDERLRHIKFLVNQARDAGGGYYHPEIGFNERMTNIEAALGLAQLERLEGFLEMKRRFRAIYREGLEGSGTAKLQKECPDGRSSFWLTCALFDRRVNPDNLLERMKAEGVPARRVFTPLVECPPYAKYKDGDYGNAYGIFERGICLPGSTLNGEDDIFSVCNMLKDMLI